MNMFVKSSAPLDVHLKWEDDTGLVSKLYTTDFTVRWNVLPFMADMLKMFIFKHDTHPPT